jgi:hypothetical protein
MTPDTLISEARARIIWGESSLSVRSFLTSNGISEDDAEAAIKEFDAERNAEIRRIGLKKTIIGTVLTVGAVFFFVFVLRIARIAGMNPMTARGFATMSILVAVAGCYGVWNLIDGVIYLVRPQSEDKSISEILE